MPYLRPYKEPVPGVDRQRSLLAEYGEVDREFDELYNAWRDLMEENGIPTTDWETVSQDLPNTPEGMTPADINEYLRANPQYLAADPLLVHPFLTKEIFAAYAGMEDTAESLLQREEFVPEDMREDYRRLTQVCRDIFHDMVEEFRRNAWLKTMEDTEPVKSLVSRRSANGASRKAAHFHELYYKYRGNRLDEDIIINNYGGTRFSGWARLTDMLRYAWGESWKLNGEDVGLTHEDGARRTDLLRDFSYQRGGMDEMPGYVSYLYFRRAGIDPDSLPGFLQAMRDAKVHERAENRELREAVMHLAAWRVEDAAEIARFGQALMEDAGARLPLDERNRRRQERIAALTENAADTLIANFDRTFGKYFTPQQMEDGSAFSHISAGGTRLSDMIRNYGGEAPQAVRMAKLDVMARILAGGNSVSVAPMLPDGTVKASVPLWLETSQPAFEAIAANSQNNRMREVLNRQFYGQRMAERQEILHRCFEDICRQGQLWIPDPDQNMAGAGAAPEAEDAAGLREALRTLQGYEGYRASLPARLKEGYDIGLRLLQDCAQNLEQVRREQEFLRAHPQLQEVETMQRPRGLVLRGRSLDGEMMEAEASRLRREGTALAQALLYGIGRIGSADRDRILSGENGSILRGLLNMEEINDRMFLDMVEELHSSVPEDVSRFANTEAVPLELTAADEETVRSFRPRLRDGEREVYLARLQPEQRQYAARNFDPVMDLVFDRAERERLAARGMDIYDRIFVEGRSLSDLYRQVPERRPYEQMESDMKCRFMENILTGKRIDVMVPGAEGRPVLRRLLPYESSGVLQANGELARDEVSIPRTRTERYRADSREEEVVRSAAEESRQRLEHTLNDPAALMDRKEYIRYGQGNGAPAREDFAAMPGIPWTEKVFSMKAPLKDISELSADQRTALADLRSMQLRVPGAAGSGSLQNRLLIQEPAEDEDRQARRARLAADRRTRQARMLADTMFENLVRTTGADQADSVVMRKMGFRVPEQLFLIGGIPAEEYLEGIEEYKGLTRDYRPDSAYMSILRGEIISASLGNVPVDLIIPEETGLNIRTRMREISVDYSDYRDVLTGWRPAPEEDREARHGRALDTLRKNHLPRIWLGENPGEEPAQDLQEQYKELRRYRYTGNEPMPEPLRDRADALFDKIMGQLGLKEQEKNLLTDTGVMASEAELFYINGMPALDFVRQNIPSLRNLQRDSENFDRILKAEVAAAAVSGRRMVEVGRVYMDAAGSLKAGVSDVHVDLSHVRIPSDSDISDRELNAVLRDPLWNVDPDERRRGIRADLQARIDRAETIRYAVGNSVAYSAAARRFDQGRPDMVSAYIGAPSGTGEMLKQYSGFLGGDEEANRAISSMAQMYLLSQRPDIRMADLTDPDKWKDEKREAGGAVLSALRKGMEGGGWEAYDAIAASVAHMISPLPEQGLPQQLGDVKPLDMRKELITVMGLDPDRTPAYSQAELLRLMDSRENSPRVGAMLAYAAQAAGDAKALCRPRMEQTVGRTGALAVWDRDRTAAFSNAVDGLQLIGRAERQWQDAARNYQRIEDRKDPEEMAAAGGNRMNVESARRVLAAGGTLPERFEEIQRVLNIPHRDHFREMFRRQDPSASWIRDMAERPYGELRLNEAAPAVAVSIEISEQQRRMQELDTLVEAADRNMDLPVNINPFVRGYATDLFERMFERGPAPVFGMKRMEELSKCGLDMMDRIYIDGRSVRDLYGAKYSSLSSGDALNSMKTEFVVQMLKGARIDVAAERNGVETLAALAVQTDIRRINRRAWFTDPEGALPAGQVTDPAEPVRGVTVPPMSPETAARIYESQWVATERAVREKNGPVSEAEQEGPETQRVRGRWDEIRSSRRRDRLAEDRKTGEVADSSALRLKMTADADEAGGAEFRDQLFPLYVDAEGEFKRIFGQSHARTQDDNNLIYAAAGWMEKMIKRATYDNAPGDVNETDRTIPTRLQEMMGYGIRNMTDMFRIDGMTVKEYADAHGLSNMLEGEDAERNRKAILASALLGGEHHVDMIRSGLTANERGENVAYKTGVAEIQIDLSPFDGLVRFYQTRPSRKAERLYGDASGRSERHQKLKLAADEQLFKALTAEHQAEEAQERRELEDAMTRDRIDRYRSAQAAQIAAAQPVQQPQAQPGRAQAIAAQPGRAQATAAQPGRAQVAAAQSGRQPQAQQNAQSRKPAPVPAPRLVPAPQAKPGLQRETDKAIAGMLRQEGFQALCHDERSKGFIGTVWGQTDKAWFRFGEMRGSLADAAGTQAPQDSRVLEEEYKVLAGLFDRMELERVSDPEPAMSPGTPDTMRVFRHKEFRKFLENVETVLAARQETLMPRERLEKAQRKAGDALRRLTETLGNLQFPPAASFSDPEKLVAYNQEFVNLANLTGVMVEIDRAIHPEGRRNPDLEVMHNIFDAASKVYDFDRAKFSERCAARYVLDRFDAMVSGPAANGASFRRMMDAFRADQEAYELAGDSGRARAAADAAIAKNWAAMRSYYLGPEKPASDKELPRYPVCPIDGNIYDHGREPDEGAVTNALLQQEDARILREEAQRSERLMRLQQRQAEKAEKAKQKRQEAQKAEKAEQKTQGAQKAETAEQKLQKAQKAEKAEQKPQETQKPQEQADGDGTRKLPEASAPTPSGNPNRHLATDLQEEIRGDVKQKPGQTEKSADAKQKPEQTEKSPGTEQKSGQKSEPAPKPEVNPKRRPAADLLEEIRGTEKKQSAEKHTGTQSVEQNGKKQTEEKSVEKQPEERFAEKKSGEQSAQKKQPVLAGPTKG